MKLNISEAQLRRLLWKYFIWGKNDEQEDKTKFRIESDIEKYVEEDSA